MLEAASLAAVFPVLAYILDPVSALNSEIMQFVKPITAYLPFGQTYNLGILFAAIVLLSSAYRIFLVWLQVTWGNAVGHDFSTLIFSRLLNQSYEQHIARNTSEIVSGITIKINQLVGSYINPLVAICSSTVLLLAIAGLLILTVGLQIVAIVVLIGGIYAGITFSIKSKLSYNSQVISNRSNLIVQQVQESFQGVREVILGATGGVREAMFSRMDKEFRSAQSSSAVLSQAPRYIVESFLVILLVGVALMQAGTFTLSGELLPSLGVVVLGLQRMMPLAQVIYANVATMKGAVCSVDDVLEMASQYSEADQTQQTECEVIGFSDQVEFRHLGYRYPRSQVAQLKNVNVSIKKGEWVGFYGHTGSGKSTLLDLICGLLRPTTGAIFVDGKQLSDNNYASWRSKLAVVSQSAFFSDVAIVDIIAFGEETPDLDLLKACLKVAQLESTIHGLADGVYTRVGEAGVQLSGGQLQRLSIARALYRKAEVLIFDEATSALDRPTEMGLMDALRHSNSDLTVVLVAHRLNTLEECDSVYQMENGEIVASGTYEQLILAKPAYGRGS
ncbi:ABC transporter ATP-binding protein/permease [Alphaproteobacteria bacterium]|nr:ABC transporter ATP-binding protein/permease [Alphaproteobacteria bacterium]